MATELKIGDLVLLLSMVQEERKVAFVYTNRRGDLHAYVIRPTGIEWGHFDGAETDRWYLHGQLVSRDGNAREGVGPSRRRSFEIDELRGFMEAPDGDN